MKYRKLLPKDVEQLIGLWRILMKEHEDIEPELYALSSTAEKKVRAFFIDSMNSEEKFFYGAFEDNELVGYLFGWIEDRPPVLHIEKIGNLSDVCVKPAFRAKGIGKELVILFVKWCKARGVQIVQLQVLYDKDAVGFYKKMGFRDFMRKMVINTKGF